MGSVDKGMDGIWTHRGFWGWAEALHSFPSCLLVYSRGGERPNNTVDILVAVLLGGCDGGMLLRSSGGGLGVGSCIMTTVFAAWLLRPSNKECAVAVDVLVGRPKADQRH